MPISIGLSYCLFFARLYYDLCDFCVTGQKACGQGSSHSKGVNATGSRDKARRDTRNRVTAFFDIFKNYHFEKQTLFKKWYLLLLPVNCSLICLLQTLIFHGMLLLCSGLRCQLMYMYIVHVPQWQSVTWYLEGSTVCKTNREGGASCWETSCSVRRNWTKQS